MEDERRGRKVHPLVVVCLERRFVLCASFYGFLVICNANALVSDFGKKIQEFFKERFEELSDK